eukprot:m.662280 g.662280  ORF g.662280 m.662280 type:complete len:266 (-) comp22739_c0_seq3:2373-3170(-)
MNSTEVPPHSDSPASCESNPEVTNSDASNQQACDEDSRINMRIRVCVRKRPLGKRERRRGEQDIVDMENNVTCCVIAPKVAVDMTQFNHRHAFVFDEVFDAQSTNESVYRHTARPLVQNVVQRGCMAACFAYGQTGAGKTHTMMGVPNKLPGLYALGADDLFLMLERSGLIAELEVWTSFYEIYCGKLYDLLNKRQQLYAREDGHGAVHGLVSLCCMCVVGECVARKGLYMCMCVHPLIAPPRHDPHPRSGALSGHSECGHHGVD